MNLTRAISACSILISLSCAPVSAQWASDNRQTRWNDDFRVRRTGDWSQDRRDGRCTIRVRVDDDADVMIRGEQLRIRVFQGAKGRDEGSECNAPMPQSGNIRNFRFRGRDGRGQVRLVQEPSRSNNYVAVVNIKDSKGGDEGYTYELTWESDGSSVDSGGSGGSGAGWGSGGGGGDWNESNVRRTCENEMRSRLRSDHNANGSPAGPADFNNQNNGSVRMRAHWNVSKGSDRQRVEFRCLVSNDGRSLRSFDYRFRGSGSWGNNDGWGSDNDWGNNSGGGWGDSGGSGGAGGWNSGNIDEYGARSRCTNAIRDKLVPQFGGSLSPQSNANANDMGNNRWRVEGRARYRDGSGQQGDIEYYCEIGRNDGRVHRSDYRVLGQWSPRAQPR